MTQAQAQTPQPPPLADYPFGEMLASPEALGLVGILAFLGLLQFLPNLNRQQPKLALGRWAGAKEKKAAFIKASQQITRRRHNEVGVVLERPGFKGEQIPTSLPDLQRGVAVMGGPGSGKTFSGFLPLAYSAIDQGLPIICYDFKYPELTEKVAGLAAKRGYDLRVFAPGYPESDAVNILDFLDPEDPSLMAAQFAEVLRRNFSKGEKDSDAFFSAAGDQLVQGILMLAKESPHSDLMMCQSLLSLEELPKRIDRHQDKIKYSTFLSFSTLRASAGSEKTVAGIIATAANQFTKFMKPKLLSALTGKTTLPLDLQGKQLLVLGLDQETRDVIAPLMATIIDLIISRNCAKQRSEPLVFLLDEAPTLNLPRIVNWLNEMRSRGLCTVLGFQNIVQMERLYGKELTKAIWGGCATKLVYNPQELDSAKLISEYLGREEVKLKQTSQSTGKGGGSKNVSEQNQTRNLLDPSDLLQFDMGERIIINPGYIGGKVPGFAKLTKAYIPLREKPDLEQNQPFQGAVKASVAIWQKIQPKLAARAVKVKIIDEIMKSRYLAAKDFLSLPEKGSEVADEVLPQALSGVGDRKAASSPFPLDEATLSQALK